MCGIVGLHAPASDPDTRARLLAGMNGVQVHRGPDGSGSYMDEATGLGLAMRRLAIIDIACGQQPMSTEDGRFTLVFNGEIVNAPALRQELEASGERFFTDHSDTEVVLRLVRRDGIDAIARLNGMFAFALYDAREGLLTIARDRFGIKPLYYAQIDGTFVFASEMKSLLTLPFVSREVDRQSLFHYLSLMYVPGPATILENVRKLEAGHLLRYRLADRTLTSARWWKLRYEADRSVPANEWPERIRTELAAAVDRWMLADVPVACSLSGGLDSSAIVGLLAQAGRRVATYSLGFRGDSEAAWNELPLAADVARKWGTTHHELIMDPTSLLADLGRMVWHMDEPYGGGVPSWAVFAHMSSDVKVGITGTGGDEMFGNYGKWRGLEGRWFHRPASTESNFRKHFFDRYYYFPDAAKRSILTDASGLTDTASLLFGHYAHATGAGPRDFCATTDIETQLSDEFLAMTDRFSMAHSLEVRPPFLDNEFVDLVRSIPPELRTTREDLKGLLRQAVAPVLPPRLLNAPKKGFVLPLKLWLRAELRPLVERLLGPDRLARQGIFKPELFADHVRPHLDGREDRTTRVWGLLMFQLWHLQFVEGDFSGARALDELVEVA
jgi:asparagine synthase (glutamine-hydrolysing)